MRPAVGSAAIESEGNDESHVGLLGKDEALRQDADHGVGLTRERDRLTDDIGSASEQAHPQPVGDDDDPRPTRTILVLAEDPSELRLHIEHAEEARGRARPTRSDGLPVPEEIEPILPVRPHRFEMLRLVLPGEKVTGGDGEVRRRLVAVPDTDQSIRLGIGKRPEEHGAHDAVDGRDRAEAERERGHDREGETRARRDRSHRIGKVAIPGCRFHRSTSLRSTPLPESSSPGAGDARQDVDEDAEPEPSTSRPGSLGPKRLEHFRSEP